MNARRVPVLWALVLSACGDSNGPPDGGDDCEKGLIDVTVESPQSESPRFLWEPACPVALVEVTALVPASGVRWSINGRLLNVIGSGITYGERPFGTEVSTDPVSLEVGATYEVRVTRAIEGEDGPELGGGGSTTFMR